jgi:eukaryotic-like serine/threonine-protein kinase
MSKKQNNREKGSLLRQLFYFFAAIIFVYVLVAFLVMPLYTRHWQHNKVPDVTYISSSAAEKVIRNANLIPLLGETKFDNLAPAGFVLFQNPLADAFVKKGRRVYLVVSKGIQPVPTPNLVGVNMRDARFVLMQRQLNVGDIVYEFDAYFPEGVIMEQSIEPDIEVNSGRAVDIIVSLGEEPSDVYIPNLLGQSSEDADLMIKKARLTIGRVSYQSKNNVISPKVIFQSLKAGLKAAKGDTINLVFSTMAQGQEENIPW